MNVMLRIRTIRVLEKIEKNPDYSKKLGINDVSVFLSGENKKVKTERGI